jgi:putative adenylate-forming enzyme
MGSLLLGVSDFRTLRHNRRTLRGERLRDYQHGELGALVRFAVERSAFYRELYRGHDLSDFAALPTIDKTIATEQFDELNTAGLTREEVLAFALEMEASGDPLRTLRAPDGREYVIGMSSGTSGNKGLVVTPRELTVRLPFVFAARSGIPMRLLPWRICFMLRVFNQGFADIDSPLVHLRYVNTMTPPAQVAAEITEMRANVLTAPPSVLLELAGIASRMPSVRFLISYADVLDDDAAERIRSAFGVPLVQLYQASEGPIASACEHGTLHINEDLVYVELLDERGRPITEPGARAERMLVTNLVNRAQPLIRYEMGDLIELGPPCACGSGFRTVSRVLGRADDALRLPHSSGEVRPVWPDLVARWVISASEDVREYQVVQRIDGSLLVRLHVGGGEAWVSARDSVERALRLHLVELGFVPPPMVFVDEPPAPSASGKRKRFVRETRDAGEGSA